MARFRSTAQHDLDFHLGGATGPRYKVAAGGTIDVPDRIAHAVKASGLPFQRLPEEPGTVAPPAPAPIGETPPAHPVARHWYSRAMAERRRADDAGEAEVVADQRSRELQVELGNAASFVAAVRARLELGAEDSVLDRLDELQRAAGEVPRLHADRLHAEAEIERLRTEIDQLTAPATAPEVPPDGTAPASPALPAGPASAPAAPKRGR